MDGATIHWSLRLRETKACFPKCHCGCHTAGTGWNLYPLVYAFEGLQSVNFGVLKECATDFA